MVPDGSAPCLRLEYDIMFPADERPFLDSIRVNPFEDGPRLVYADYLDDTGNPLDARRAELVRTQVAIARLPQEHARRAELANREAELLDAHGRDWTAPLASLGAKFQFRRGVPDTVAIDAATFLSRGEELFDNTQIRPGRSFVRRVKLHDPARVLAELVECPLLNQIEELDLGWSDLGNGGVSLLVSSHHLGAVAWLNLENNRLDDAGVLALARAATLPQLRSLAMNDNGQIGAEGVAALAESPFLAGLLELDLAGNDVNEAGVRALVRGRATTRLHSLKLHENPIGPGIASLVQSELFARMIARDSHLDLHRCAIEASGVEALGASPQLRRGTGLNLSENYLGDAGVQALCRGELENLRTLRLGRNQIADAGAKAILATSLPRLELLDLSGNRLTRRGVEALKAAAKTRGFALEAANNGTEPMAALPPAATDVDHLAELRRRVSHPTRPR